MKKIVFNGIWMGRGTVGVSRYAENILKYMDKLLDEKQLDADIQILVPESRKQLHFKHIKIVVKGKCNSKLKKSLWEQVLFPLYVRKEKAIGVDLTLSLPIWGVDYVALHDCIYEAYPENYHGHQIHRLFYITRAKILARKKKIHIITVSIESKKEIHKYYNVSTDRIHVIGNGWEHMIDIEEDKTIFDKINLPKESEYFFSLGSRYKHKNIKWIINAARYNPNYFFVSTGSDLFSDEIHTLKKDKLENMIFTGYISDAQMKALMCGCRALIQPSYYEGFGIPPLEALSMGKEIIVSTSSCLPEIFKSSAHYIDPDEPSVSLDAVLCSDTSGKEDVLNEYKWENSAKKMLQILEVI